MEKLPSISILGVKVNPITMAQALGEMQDWIAAREPNYICCVPAHAVMACHDQPELKAIYDHAGICTPDGMAIVWLARSEGYAKVERVYGPDLLLAACQTSLETGWRHYFFGGAPGVAEKLVEKLRLRFPELQVAGIHSPPFGEMSVEEDAEIINKIQQAKPDIVWVGLGSPKQERWMSDHVDTLKVPALVGVGAAFDFLSGTKPQAPRWMQRSGLEWLFRLLSEPRRLWRRYVLGYPRFIWLVFLQKIGILKYP
jgi:N-acetylglucosaminyldiphosphoundecaprenol N-acetyl-beta-D-mannosaminyltransferase